MILLRWSFPPLGNSDHVSVSVSIDFPSNSQQNCIAYDYSCADWDGLCGLLRDVPLEDIFKRGASDAASEFCEWVQVGVIPHRKISGQASLISMVFSCLCCRHVHRNHFFPLYQKDKSSDSEVKFRQATKVKFSHHYKRVPEAARLAYANKTKEPMISQKLGSCDF